MSNTTVRWAWAVAPWPLVATTSRTMVPPWTGTSALQLPSAAAVVVTRVLAESASVLVADTSMVLPGAEVPRTVTGEAVTGVLSGGSVTVRVVACCWLVT